MCDALHSHSSFAVSNWAVSVSFDSVCLNHDKLLQSFQSLPASQILEYVSLFGVYRRSTLYVVSIWRDSVDSDLPDFQWCSLCVRSTSSSSLKKGLYSQCPPPLLIWAVTAVTVSSLEPRARPACFPQLCQLVFPTLSTVHAYLYCVMLSRTVYYTSDHHD